RAGRGKDEARSLAAPPAPPRTGAGARGGSGAFSRAGVVGGGSPRELNPAADVAAAIRIRISLAFRDETRRRFRGTRPLQDPTRVGAPTAPPDAPRPRSPRHARRPARPIPPHPGTTRRAPW